MSRVRVLGVGVLMVAMVVGGAACSSDAGSDKSSDRGPVSFADPPEGSTDLGLCSAYELAQIKEPIGGKESFKRLPPAAIGAKGDPVTGESCGWERNETNGDSTSLKIEVRDYGDDLAGLTATYDALQEGTISASPVVGVGDGAFTSESDETSLLQVRTGHYLLTLSSRSGGDLKPVDIEALELLAAAGIDQLP